MLKLTKKEKEALFSLSREHAAKSKFVTVLDRDSLNYILNNGYIYLTGDLKGYMIFDGQRIIAIYSSIDSYDDYFELLSNIDSNAKFIAPLESNNLVSALRSNNFKLTREHHQLVKDLIEQSFSAKLEFSPLKNYCTQDVLMLIKEVAPHVIYTVKEINEAKKSPYSFAYQDLKAVCIAYQNPLGLYLEEIVVKEAYQNQGIGQEMLKFLHNKASQKYDKIYLHVYNDNVKAYSLYQKLGYKLDKVIAYWER